MSAEAIQYDTSRLWRPEDLFDIDDERHHYEIADGVLEVTPPPHGEHAYVVSGLVRVVDAQLPDDIYCAFEFGIAIGRSYREPDFGIVRRVSIPEGTMGLPPASILLLAEALSESTAANDRVVKPREYARAGIGVYLLLDREAREITVHLLDAASGTYRVKGVYGAGETVRLDHPVPLTIPVDHVFA